MLLGTLGTSLFWNLLTGKGIYRAGKGKGISRACTKNKKRIQKFKETGDTSYIYKNELDKACFQHDMAYGDFKDLKRRTASDKDLKDKEFNITLKILNMTDIKEDLHLWFINFLIKSRKGVVLMYHQNLMNN